MWKVSGMIDIVANLWPNTDAIQREVSKHGGKFESDESRDWKCTHLITTKAEVARSTGFKNSTSRT